MEEDVPSLFHSSRSPQQLLTLRAELYFFSGRAKEVYQRSEQAHGKASILVLHHPFSHQPLGT